MRRTDGILARMRVITSGQNHLILSRGFGRAFADRLQGDAAVLVAVGEAAQKIRKVERRFARMKQMGMADETAFEILSGQRHRAMAELDTALGSLFGDDDGEDDEAVGIRDSHGQVPEEADDGTLRAPGGAIL